MAVARKAPVKAPVKKAPVKAPAKAPAKDRLDPTQLAASYGYVNAVINSNTELKKLFASAYGSAKTGEWTADKFKAAVQNTQWYKQHSDQWRQTEAIRLADPSTYTASVDAQTAIVKETAAKMGATITDAQARAMGETAYRTGYNGQQLQQALGTYVASGAPGTKAPGGVAGQTEQTLKDYAASMGVQLSDSYFQGAEKSVAAGLSDATTWQNDIKEQAKSLYVPMAARIDQGATVADMASSYVNQMASTLEVDPNTINLQDTTIQKALKGTVDQKTGQPALQSLWDFDQTLKQDPRWQYTKNANQLAASTASSVLQLMGFQ